ncbi:hypothetical protein GEMRC1_005092 [Eukaryota sp. GEM-RC1]
MFEFVDRFPNDISLTNLNSCKYLFVLNEALIKLPFDVWSQCLPESVSEIAERCLTNLQFCLKKLQHKLTKIFESLDYNVRLGMAKETNPAFANFLTDVSKSSSSCLIPQIPHVYGLFLDDNSWSLNMPLRSFSWPDNLPHNLKCQCEQCVTPTHLVNCICFISFRSKVHDSVRDQLYCMCKSYGIVSFLEPVLAGLVDDTDVDKSFGNSRGEVIFPGLDGCFIIADVMSIDVCNGSKKKLAIYKARNPLLIGEKEKRKKLC